MAKLVTSACTITKQLINSCDLINIILHSETPIKRQTLPLSPHIDEPTDNARSSIVKGNSELTCLFKCCTK